jgi:hypothetical protein
VTSGLSPIRQKPWAIIVLLLGLLAGPVALVVAPAAGLEPVPAVAEGAQGEVSTAVDDADFAQAVPDLVVRLEGGDDVEAELSALLGQLEDAHGVVWATSDLTTSPHPNILIGLDSERHDSGLRAVESILTDHPSASRLTMVGQALIDRDVGGRFGRTTVVAVILAAVLAAALAGWLARRPHHGLLVGAAVAVSGALGATIGAKVAGPFDGSLATTAIPALLAALLMSICLSLRLLAWFHDPTGDDQADMIRRSVAAVGLELGLLFTGLLVVVGFLELVGPGRSVALVFSVGAVTGTVLTLAVVPPVLAGLHGADLGVGPRPDAVHGPLVSLRSMVTDRPNGRHFPVGILLAFGFFFGFLSLLALTTPTVAELADRSTGPDAGDPAVQALYDQLYASGGDPTAAVLAVFPTGTDQLAKSAWLSRVSQLPSVGRVDASSGRYTGGDLLALGASPTGPIGAVLDGDEAPRFALVVPVVAGRSEAARDLVDEIEATNAPVDAELSGVPVDARRAADRDRSVVWVTMISLAVVAGVAVFVLVGDPALAGLAAGLRLLDTMAAVGLYHLLAGDVSGAELVILVFTLGLGIGLFELSFLRRLLADHHVEDSDELIEVALAEDGLPAAMAMIVVAVSSLGFVLGGTGALVRLGVVLFVAVGIELVIGLWLLRPAVLGTRAIFHFAAQPVRDVLRALAGQPGADDPDQQRWTQLVAQLLAAEFDFQADPGVASMDSVFEPDTPLFRKAVEHHQSLASAGLRIIGRPPQLRSVRMVAVSPVPTVAVTVDHPIRQLIDEAGKIVGVRKAERRSVMLWLAEHGEGYRIADSVELGALPLGVDEAPVPLLSAPQPSPVE